jgi:hypothetical protein
MSERKPSEGDLLYEKYGKPLEGEHWGELVAIDPKGKIILGTDLGKLTWDAAAKLDTGHYIFRVGEKAVGTIR